VYTPSISAPIEQHGARDVRALLEAEALARSITRVAQDPGDQADREVDEEDPVPVDGLSEDAAASRPIDAPAEATKAGRCRSPSPARAARGKS